MITSTTPEAIQTALEEVERGEENSCAVRPLESRLRTAMTPMVNEGFFSDVVVLVEGEEDQAALVGVAKTMEIDLNAYGISVIPCHGKGSLPKVGTVFRQLGIPLYVVWDNDKDKGEAGSPTTNRRLLRLCGQTEEDWPEGVFERYACLGANLTNVLRHELGEEFYDTTFADIRQEFGLGNWNGAKKNPIVVTELIIRAKESGITSPTIEGIINHIVAIKFGLMV